MGYLNTLQGGGEKPNPGTLTNRARVCKLYSVRCKETRKEIYNYMNYLQLRASARKRKGVYSLRLPFVTVAETKTATVAASVAAKKGKRDA